jgi:hypothetical protein
VHGGRKKSGEGWWTLKFSNYRKHGILFREREKKNETIIFSTLGKNNFDILVCFFFKGVGDIIPKTLKL